jgi:3-dehydroquinate dehydratase/shikimate dehydrogenase
MTRRAVLAATLTSWPYDLRGIPDEVSQLEVRADLAGDVDPGELRRDFAGTLVYTLRGAAGERHRRLAWAAERYDVVELDADLDLDPQLLDVLPAQRRRVSWHGPALPAAALRARFVAMARTPAAGYLLAPAATRSRDALAPLRLLRELGRRDVTAYGTGPAGTWSRLLAPWLGASVVTGALDPGDGDDGALTVAGLLTDYGFPAMPPLRDVCGIAGAVARTTGFPGLHNRAYRARGVPSLFLPFYLPSVDDFRTGFWPHVPDGLRELGLPLRGCTVSGPLKEAALRVVDEIGPAALACGSANILVARGGGWLADTTDTAAVAAVLRRAGVPTTGRSAVVLGCGGAGRAAAVALTSGGARVTLVNRTEARGRAVARRLGTAYASWGSVVPSGATVVVNATPVRDAPPVPLDALTADAAVVDLVCAPADTALIAEARRLGLRAIDGWAVLAAEAEQQFRLMTGVTMPPPAGARRTAEGAGHVSAGRS